MVLKDVRNFLQNRKAATLTQITAETGLSRSEITEALNFLQMNGDITCEDWDIQNSCNSSCEGCALSSSKGSGCHQDLGLGKIKLKAYVWHREVKKEVPNTNA